MAVLSDSHHKHTIQSAPVNYPQTKDLWALDVE